MTVYNYINYLATTSYVVSLTLYFLFFIVGKRRNAARISLFCAFILSTIYEAGKTLSLGHIPFSTNIESIHFLSWILILVLLVVSYLGKKEILSIFILPVVILIEISSHFLPVETIVNEKILSSIWFEIHVTTTLVSYTAFSFAFILAIMYLFLFSELKKKTPGFFFSKLPPLATIEELNVISVVFGFVFLTIGIISGFIWKSRISSLPISQDPKIILSFFIWLLYFSSIHLRQKKGFKGIRIVYLSIVGFILILFNFIFLKFLFPASHSF